MHVGWVSLEHRNASSESKEVSEDELHQLLEEAELRRAVELSRMGRKVTLIIGIPLALILAWAGIFLMQYHAEQESAAANSVIPVRQAESVGEGRGEFDAFLPDAMRGEKPAQAAPSDGKMVSKEDISFAMDLLNFGSAPKKPKKSEEGTPESALKEH